MVWTNSSSGEAVASLPSVPRTVTPRHSVEEGTLDLLIDEVDLLDSESMYQCQLKVLDPQDHLRVHFYARSEDVELIVYGKQLHLHTTMECKIHRYAWNMVMRSV